MKRLQPAEIKTAVWLNQQKAYIIRIPLNGDPVMEKIESGVESRVRFPGENKAYTRFGTTFIDDQEKKQRRQKHQRQRYFNEIINRIKEAGAIYIFGPGKAKMELVNVIESDRGLLAKVLAVETADRLTKNQLVEKARIFFNYDSTRTEKPVHRRKKSLYPGKAP